MQPDGFLEELPETPDDVLLAAAVVGREVQIPVALDPRRPARRGDQQMPWLQLVHPRDDALGKGGAPEREEMVERAPVERARDVGELEEGPELRRKQQPAIDLGVIERLDPDPVSGQEQLSSAVVPEREGEHATQIVDTPRPVFLVQVHDRLGVARRPEPVTAGLEVGPQLGEVVDLAVEDQPHRAVLVGDRLVAGGEVDDAEAAHPEHRAGPRVEAFIVRAAVDHGAAQGAHLIETHGLSGQASEAGETTHNELVGSSGVRSDGQRDGEPAVRSATRHRTLSILRVVSQPRSDRPRRQEGVAAPFA